MISAHLAFEAGRVAQRRGWDNVELVEPESLATLSPSGPPVMVLCGIDIDVDQARTVAALHAAGRKIALLTERPPVPDALAWLPGGVLNMTEWYGWTRDGYGESHGPVFGSVAETATSTYGPEDGPWYWILSKLVSHPNATRDLLDDLMQMLRATSTAEAGKRISVEIAAHPNASPDALVELSASDDPWVLLHLLERDDLPDSAVARLRSS